ncbi:granzyme A-like [Eublepharis macularius]|uniref:Granzyme A-like n=1 Tax=Eublepharis macularius TaxID=481883 RepID=A0AA97JR56_EUBMA|nr:granzyme A-like [Eublepharis macularius]
MMSKKEWQLALESLDKKVVNGNKEIKDMIKDMVKDFKETLKSEVAELTKSIDEVEKIKQATVSSQSSGDCADIIGGKESNANSRPYMAFIKGPKSCGGTLIHENWVLTAAHCLITPQTTVILGAHSLSNHENGKQTFRIIRFFRHPSYSSLPLQNDIMLLQLNGKARINRYVQTIQLPKTFGDIREGTQCLVVGWGKNEKEWISDRLREVNVFVKNRGSCQRKYNSNYPVTLNNLCAGGFQNKRQGTCKGDSGGPLICGGIQTGITSFGHKYFCAHPDSPDVFTRLTKGYLQWIHKVIRG